MVGIPATSFHLTSELRDLVPGTPEPHMYSKSKSIYILKKLVITLKKYGGNYNFTKNQFSDNKLLVQSNRLIVLITEDTLIRISKYVNIWNVYFFFTLPIHKPIRQIYGHL